MPGQPVADAVFEQLKGRIDALNDAGHQIGIGTILVGEESASVRYVGMKMSRAQELGWTSPHIHLPEDATQADVLAILGLALLPIVLVRWAWWWRPILALLAAVAAVRVAAGVTLLPVRPLDTGSGFGLGDSFSTLGTQFGHGFTDFYGTHLPFDPRAHAAMGELVLVAIFCFALLVALLASARQPVAAALVLLAGAGWPATLLGPSHGVAMGAAILAAALLLLAGLGSRRVPAIALPAAAVVAMGAVAVGSATAASHGLVHWQSWNPAHIAGGPVGFGFVWNAQYGGLDWPAQPTVVLQVKSAQSP